MGNKKNEIGLKAIRKLKLVESKENKDSKN